MTLTAGDVAWGRARLTVVTPWPSATKPLSSDVISSL